MAFVEAWLLWQFRVFHTTEVLQADNEQRSGWANHSRLQKNVKGLLGGLKLVRRQPTRTGECRRAAACVNAVTSSDTRIRCVTGLAGLQDSWVVLQDVTDWLR